MGIQHFHTRDVICAHRFDAYPLEWDQIFGRQASLAVEIGFGNGEFLVNWAKQHPDWNFVGIDRSIGSTERLQKRLLQNSVGNVRIIIDDARFSLRELFSDNSIQQVIMNFPDPWPKKRHKERRLLQPSFIKTLAAVLKIQGKFELVTDQSWLVEETRSLFFESHFFELKKIEKNPNRLVGTKYERKWRDSGGEIYRIVSIKEKNASVSRILEDSLMPHTIIQKEVAPQQVQELAKVEHSEENKMFVVKEIFSDFGYNNYLLRLITKDVDYLQKFCVLITKHRNNWLVKLDETSPVYRTPAVKLAIQKIGEILCS